MKLKDVLGKIEADGAHLVHGRLLEWALTPPLWHAEAVGGVHTIKAFFFTVPNAPNRLGLVAPRGRHSARACCRRLPRRGRRSGAIQPSRRPTDRQFFSPATCHFRAIYRLSAA